MGDISIMARRLKDGHVQYGWSGNGGYFSWTGCRLLEWYQDPDDVEYLFGLGQTALIGRKGSEYGGFRMVESHEPTGEPCWLGTSERYIFSKIAFVDYGYLYDTDNHWYFVQPGPFRVKMPLELISNNLDEDDFEFEFLHKVEDKILKFMFNEYKDSHPEFEDYLEKGKYSIPEIMENITDDGTLSIYYLFEKYRGVFNYFDDWILIKSNEENTEITEIVIKKKEDKHIETIEW